VLGPMLAAQARSILTTTVVLIAGMVGGVMLPGLASTLILYLFALLFGAAASFWAIGVALRARTIQAAPIMQLVVFLSVFMSVAYVPQSAMTGWLAAVAQYNPVTYILDAARSAELTGMVIWSETWPGLLAALGLMIVLGAFLLSFSAGLLSQTPGGIGGMEAVFLALVNTMPPSDVIAALLVWRLMYLLIPLAL
jgi:ABC-type polysaccharide/polyol phosphate export permease